MILALDCSILPLDEPYANVHNGCMDIGFLAAIAAVVAAGTLSALIRGWSLLARLYTLEDRLNIVEGVQTREVKNRAAGVRWTKRDAEQAVLEAALEAPKPQTTLPWWAVAAQKHPRTFTSKG